MHVVLFGAGASHGSETSGKVPPLGRSLFDELVDFAPATWGALSSHWSDQFRDDFEKAMASYIESDAFGAPLQWDMAEYFYSQFSATKDNTYLALIQAVASKIDQCFFATLNYDLLLFQARKLAGIPSENLKVCLPHGSACLCCEGISATQGTSFTGGLSTGGSIRFFRDLADLRAEKANNVFPPVMSYFEPNKFTVSCSDFVEAERRQLEQSILSATKVAIVGVKVHPIDKHIWEPLVATKAQILYLSGVIGANEFLNWRADVGRSGDIPIPKFFSEGLNELINFLA